MHHSWSSGKGHLDLAQGICSQRPTQGPKVAGLLPSPHPHLHTSLCIDLSQHFSLKLLVSLVFQTPGVDYALSISFSPAPTTVPDIAVVRQWWSETLQTVVHIQTSFSLWGKHFQRGLMGYSTFNIKKTKIRNSSSPIKTKRKFWLCLTDCPIPPCNRRGKLEKLNCNCRSGNTRQPRHKCGAQSVRQRGSWQLSCSMKNTCSAGSQERKTQNSTGTPTHKNTGTPLYCRQDWKVRREASWSWLEKFTQLHEKDWISLTMGREWNSTLLFLWGCQACSVLTM